MASLIISANITFNFDSNVLSVTNSKSSINITSNGYTYSSDSIGYDTVTGTWTVNCSDGYIIDTVTNEDSTNYIISNITEHTYTYSASSTNQTIEAGINDVINIKTKRANSLTSDIETKLIINEMTDSQFETLKDENGKIPSLANQLIITSDDPTVNIQIDNTLSTTSYNPVQNKVITTALEAKIDAHKPSSYNANEIYNNGLYLVSNGSNLPSSNQYGSLFTLPYSNLRNNTQTNYASQIYLPNGDDPEKPNSMFYRNSGLDTWNDWKEIVNTSDNQSITGIKVFNRYKAQVKTSDNETRFLLATFNNLDITTEKRYVLTALTGNDVVAARSGVYSQNNKLHSNDSEVVNLADAQTVTGYKTFTKRIIVNQQDSYYSLDIKGSSADLASTPKQERSIRFVNDSSTWYIGTSIYDINDKRFGIISSNNDIGFYIGQDTNSETEAVNIRHKTAEARLRLNSPSGIDQLIEFQQDGGTHSRIRGSHAGDAIINESDLHLWGSLASGTKRIKLDIANQNFFPETNNTFSVGKANSRFKNGYFADLVYAKSPESDSNAEELATTQWVRDSIDITGVTTDMVTLVKGLINTSDSSKSAKYARWICKINGAAATDTASATGSYTIKNIPVNVAFTCEAICTRFANASDYGYQLRFVASGTHMIYRTYVTQSSTTLTWYQDVMTVGNQTVDGNKTFTGTTVFSKTTDAGETTDNNVAVIIGNRAGQHIAIDGNEILSKNGPTSAGELWINDTGNVYVGTVAKFESKNNQLIPQSNGTKNLGSTSYKWKNGYFYGNLYADAFQSDNEDWGQFQAYSKSGVYHAFEANDNSIRFDCRNFSGAGTDNRRILDINCSRQKTDPNTAVTIWTAYTSLLKTGSIIKSGSKLNGTTYSTDTTLNADLNITASSTLKTGSTVKADSIVNGNKYTADTVTTADITLTRNAGTTNYLLTDARVKNYASLGALAGTTTWSGSTAIPTLNTIAWWDGRYASNGNASNLKYAQNPSNTDTGNRIVTIKWVKDVVKLYNHIIKLDFSGIRVFLTIVNNSSTKFTADTLHKYFVDNSITGSDVDGNFYPCTGFLKSYADIILGINSHDDGNDSTSVFGLVHHYGTSTTGIVTRSSPTVTDNVVLITF